MNTILFSGQRRKPVNEELGTCPRIPVGVQCGGAGEPGQPWSSAKGEGGPAWGQRCLHVPVLVLPPPGVTGSHVDAVTLHSNSRLAQTFSSAQNVHFVPLKSPGWLLITAWKPWRSRSCLSPWEFW